MSTEQQRICGSEPAWEISRNSKGTWKTVAPETWKPRNATRSVHNKSNFSGWWRSAGTLVACEYEQKFADLPEHVQMTKLCSDAGLAKTVEKGQYFTTLDDEEPDRLKGSCREYTLPRSDRSSQVRGWIRGNTKIGPVLDVMVCYHQGRCGVELMIESYLKTRLVLGSGL